MNRVLRTTFPTTRKQRAPQVPDQKEVKTRDEKEKLKQEHNFDKHHGARPLSTVQTRTKVLVVGLHTLINIIPQILPGIQIIIHLLLGSNS